MREIRVAFDGGFAREGPLTLSQRNMIRAMEHQPTDGHNFSLSLTVPLPSGATAGAAVDAVRTLVQRHESLRTTYVPGDEIRQRVAGSGEFVAELHDGGPDQLHEATARLTATRIDPTAGPPLRMAVCAPPDRPGWVVLVISHIAVDAASVRVLRRQLEDLLGAPGGRRPPAAARQPLDQAAAEATTAARARADRALGYWRDRLMRGPQCMFAVPELPARVPYRQGRLRSPTLGRAAAAVAARTRTNRSTVLLAALSALVGRYTGQAECVVTAVAGNRYVPELHGFVGQLSQDALMSFPLTAASFDGLVRAAWTASLNGYRHSQFDPIALWRVIAETGHARGTAFARDFVFNDLSGYAARPTATTLTGTEFAWLPAPDLPARFVCYVNRLDDEAELVVWADVRRLAPAGLEAIARGVERLVVTAASGDVELSGLDKLTGVAPVTRGPEWLRVDSSWVDLTEVRRLVHDALPGYPTGVFEAEGRLVAFVAAGPDPRDAHRACMALLAGRETAMAPHRYVDTDRAPDDPGDEGAWRALPVTAEGTGRG